MSVLFYDINSGIITLLFFRQQIGAYALGIALAKEGCGLT